MNHLFCPLLPKDELKGPVLCLAAHPDDEMIGCGAMLAWHAAQGHEVTVLHMTDGAQGDPDEQYGGESLPAIRRREGIEALRRIGITDLRHWDLPDGELPEHRVEVVKRLRELMGDVRPATLYSFYFNEGHRDHRLVAHATADCADALPADCRCLLYGVNQVPSGGTMFDTTQEYPKKRDALGAYASQLAYIDFVTMSGHRDHAATVNIGNPSVEYVELFADLRPHQIDRVRRVADESYRLLLGDLQ